MTNFCARAIWTLFWAFCLAIPTHAAEWSWVYRKNYSQVKSPANRNKFRNKLSLTLTKTGVPAFTQLICSWNAQRPQRGSFTFWASVRDGNTGQWDDWHKLAEWGAVGQRTFRSNARFGSHHEYVRLEVPPGFEADAFRVQVKAHDGADLLLVKAIVVNVIDFRNFEAEYVDIMQFPSVSISDVPAQSQMILEHERARHLCYPTAFSMASGYLCGETVDPLEFAQGSYDENFDIFGGWALNAARAFEVCGGRAYVYPVRLSSFAGIYRQLLKGMPVPVSVRGTLQGSATPYAGGHLLLVVGWDQGRQHVLVHDPAFDSPEEVVTSYPLHDFLAAWERSRRLAYLID